MTPTQLKTLIEGLANDHPAKVAFIAADDVACAAALNAKTLPGYVPIREVSAYCVTQGLSGALQAMDSIPIGADISPGNPMTLQIKGLLKNVLVLLLNDFRLEEVETAGAEFGVACDGLINLGIMTTDQKAALVAMSNNRTCLAAVDYMAVSAARRIG